jgi:transcriptional regulator
VYIPSAFRLDDLDLIREIVRTYSFATLVSTLDGEPFATHLPILLGSEGDRDVLFGHVARANPHWKAFGARALMIFSGPHGYVSPSWYETRPNVPTWNYVTVHAYGTPQVMEDPATKEEHLRLMVDFFDPQLHETHPESTSVETLRRLGPGVVVFQMVVDRWEAKTKLNQNRAETDRLAVRDRYLRSESAEERAMGERMRGEGL